MWNDLVIRILEFKFDEPNEIYEIHSPDYALYELFRMLEVDDGNYHAEYFKVLNDGWQFEIMKNEVGASPVACSTFFFGSESEVQEWLLAQMMSVEKR